MYSSSQQQMPMRANALSVQVPPTMNFGGHNDLPSSNVHGPENESVSKAESIVNPSKKLENDMLLIGKKIKQHEENIKFLKTHKNSLDDVITDKQVTLGKYHSSTAPKIEDEDLSHMQSEEATIGNIMKYEKSAASIFYQLKRQRNQAAHIKDILGVVATLGKVNDDNLGRLLSEYLGLDNMMSLVCISYDGIKALVSYDKEGGINKSSGLYGLGTAIGQTLEGRFNVICLENLRPYIGEFLPNDQQKRLDLSKPRLPNGETPPGFIGFAVNMIHIDNAHLFYLTHDGNGLRETLFYTLFSRLQVYKTRTEMLQALPCIYDGAISLDGGMIKSTGVYSLGTREEIDVKFPITSGVSYLPEAYLDVEKEMKELKWKRERMMEDIQREEAMLSHVKYSFEVKKQEFLGFMAQSSPYTMQVRAKASGCSDLDVMKVALADYHTKTKKRFGHVASWDVVKGHDKWHEQDCFQQVGGSNNSSKRKSGEYESASNENIIPDMNEDPIPPIDSRKSKKKQGASSSSISSVAEDISSYAQRKQQYLDEKREKDKLAADLLAAQLDGAKFKNRQHEMKFFFEPHDHITDPEHLEAVLNDKREIGRKNGWKIYF